MIKHIDLRYKWIQEKVESGEFEIEYVSTKDQVSDIFTKPLSRELFQKFRKELGVMKLSDIERECSELLLEL